MSGEKQFTTGHRETDENQSHRTAIQSWLENFAVAVRAQNYDAGKALFAPDVVSFGTYADMLYGRDALIEGQWKNVWNTTRDFEFNFSNWHFSAQENLAWACILWHSQKPDKNGVWQNRPGRATFVFEQRAGKWLAIHSHFSLHPSFLINNSSENL